MDKFILRVFQNSTQEFGHLKKMVGVIDATGMHSLISNSGLNANPRAPRLGKVVDEITDSLETSSELFMFKSKGILLSSFSVEELDRKRFKLSYSETSLEGILDGGHNTLAIGIFLLKNTFPEKTFSIKSWIDLKKEWDQFQVEILEFIKTTNFDFLVPIEILFPSDEKYKDQFINHILEISSSRNNNAQLTESTKGNHRGYYKNLSNAIDPSLNDSIEWKSGDIGKRIKSPDIISLALIPFIAIAKKEENNHFIPSINPISLYSGKGKCVSIFNEIIENNNVSKISGNEVEIINKKALNALHLMREIPQIYDYLYKKFPDAFNKNGGSFGRIGCVKSIKEGDKKRFYTKFYEEECKYNYPDGFIMPIVSSIHALIEVNENEVRWKVPNPISFLEKHLEEIVSLFVGAIKSLDYNPQSVAKSRHSYDVLEQSFKMALYKDQIANNKMF